MSGFTLNYDKTSVMRIGSLRNSNAVLFTKRTVSWTNEPVNILGVWVSTNLSETVEKNYSEIVAKARQVLKKWKSKKASLFGKIMLVNTLISSLFVYRMTVLPRMPTSLLSEIKKDILHFIWNGA